MAVEVALLLTKTLFSLILLAVVLRFLLQLSNADYYNPITQLVMRSTRLLIRPFTLILPRLGRVNLAALTLALTLELAAAIALITITGIGLPSPIVHLVIWAALGLANFTLDIYFFALLISVIASWVAPHNTHHGLTLIHQLVGPILNLFRRSLPATSSLDFSPLIMFLMITVLQITLRSLAKNVALIPAVIIGF